MQQLHVQFPPQPYPPSSGATKKKEQQETPQLRPAMEQMKLGNNGDYFICNASIIGNNNRVWGHRNSVTGNGNEVCGNCNTVVGENNSVKGLNNRVVGQNNSIVDLPCGGGSGVANSGGARPSEAQSTVSVCNRMRIRTDSQGRRSCENVHVELVERATAGGSPAALRSPHREEARQNSSCPTTPRHYDLSALDGVDSNPPPPAEATAETASSTAAAIRSACSVCLCRERCVKLSPCRHVPVCLHCARRLFSGARTRSVLCPLCRCPVEEVERLFLG